MDGFMDKIAHKLGTAGEAIRANTEADARALKEARSRVRTLESGIEEMKRLSHKCAEINELTEQLAKGAIERLEEAEGKQIPVVTEENTPAASDELKNLIEDSFKKQEDTIHQENVRVYRNVQASIVDELKQQSEAIAAEHLHMEKKVRGIKPIAIIALVFSGISMCTSVTILLILLGVISF
ncbi:MAG: hypothetical protein K6E19_11265 [Lachnospiraceae bacterium]|nr:hypothetical protein [Lachnospiraceae bacterium]